MPKIEIYTQAFCGYCHRAKRILDQKGVAYEEFDVMMEPTRRREMIQRAEGRSTTPQVFIDGKPIGGCDDLTALAASGELDRLLGAVGA
jgi:glutaredoxin 3